MPYRDWTGLVRTLFILAGVLVARAESLAAQLDFLEGVFKKVTDVAISPVLGSSIRGGTQITDAGSGLALTGLAFEVSFGLGDLFAPNPPDYCSVEDYEEIPESKEITRRAPDTSSVRDTAAVEVMTHYGLEKRSSPRFKNTPEGRDSLERDTTARKLLAQAQSQAKVDSSDVWTRWQSLCGEVGTSLGLELALGYTQLAGYRGRQVDLRGSIEELPAITLYGTLNQGRWVEFYAGLRTGLVQTKGLRALSGTSVSYAEGSTFQFGVVGPGVLVGDPEGDWGIFLEPAFTFRKFDALKWAEGTPPSEVLRSLDFSAFTLALGGQIPFGSDDDEEKESAE